MTEDRLDEIDAQLAALAPHPWHECGRDRGGCTCGIIWDATGGGVVAIAQSVDNGGMGEGYSAEAMQRHARFIADAPALVAELVAALRAAQS